VFAPSTISLINQASASVVPVKLIWGRGWTRCVASSEKSFCKPLRAIEFYSSRSLFPFSLLTPHDDDAARARRSYYFNLNCLSPQGTPVTGHTVHARTTTLARYRRLDLLAHLHHISTQARTHHAYVHANHRQHRARDPASTRPRDRSVHTRSQLL
jgi:hypothetical protein